MNTQRDELAKVIVAAYGEDAEAECPCEQDLDVADAILAAGFRKPRLIETAEELDALPFESVVKTADGDVWESFYGGWYETACRAGRQAAELTLPASVLYEPDQP